MIDPKPTLTSVINKHFDKRLGALAKGLPGNVVSYDEASETATIRLGVFRLVPSLTNPDLDEVEQVPDLFNVPIAWPRARGYALVGTLSAGDPVAVHGLDRDISGWRRSNKASEPDDARTHTWAAAFAVPGLQADVERFPAPAHAAALDSKVAAEFAKVWKAIEGHIHPVSGASTLQPSAVSNANPPTIGWFTTATATTTAASTASAILKLES